MTASLQLRADDHFLQVDKLNMKSIAKKKNLAKVICDYLLFVDHNPKKALELSIESEQNWWWKSKQGISIKYIAKCHFLLG